MKQKQSVLRMNSKEGPGKERAFHSKSKDEAVQLFISYILGRKGDWLTIQFGKLNHFCIITCLNKLFKITVTYRANSMGIVISDIRSDTLLNCHPPCFSCWVGIMCSRVTCFLQELHLTLSALIIFVSCFLKNISFSGAWLFKTRLT